MKLALVFPGQGSQSVGMMAGYEAFPVVRETFVEGSAVLAQDLWLLVTEGPDEALNQTVNTQPAMLAADVAVHRAWRAAGGPARALLRSVDAGSGSCRRWRNGRGDGARRCRHCRSLPRGSSGTSRATRELQ